MDQATIDRFNKHVESIMEKVGEEAKAVRGVPIPHETILARYILYRVYVMSTMDPQVFSVMDQLATKVRMDVQKFEQAGEPC